MPIRNHDVVVFATGALVPCTAYNRDLFVAAESVTMRRMKSAYSCLMKSTVGVPFSIALTTRTWAPFSACNSDPSTAPA